VKTARVVVWIAATLAIAFVVIVLLAVAGCAHQERGWDPKRALLDLDGCTFKGCMSCGWNCLLGGYPVEGEGEGEGE
jgi:hypothetical protein